ncbi:response regulator [Patescibacteria group bacterium]|uniref:Response regulator n=1 Tax=candidate division WWE3 bacterium TaxID=2053526 RepID=A0A928TQY9_UNCKA|nr:response regulator [candidate division WWE3 bacterium]MCL4732432.1 response regulator [Patescibacteria group bacterium]MDL1952661.1 response regulator [Candidatus Uhrbacteria bacterium UHB]RIL01206.1 MAG: response regulator [Candidatus Uhrbacteria bacterium]
MATILIVDDDNFLQAIYQKRFEDGGFDVITASNGEDALRLARNRRPDLIVSDIVMPRMDGFALLGAISEDPELSRIPVMMLTELAHQKDIDLCRSLGCAEYLIKSHVKPEEVVLRARRILRM